MRALFERHVEQNMVVPVAGSAVQASLRRGVLQVAGQTEAATVRLAAGSAAVDLAVGADGRFAGFLVLPDGVTHATVRCCDDLATLSLPDAAAAARARWRHLPRFAADLARATPLLLRWWVGGRPASLIAAIRARLSLSHVPVAGLLDARRLDRTQPIVIAIAPDRPVQIVMPVFNALTVLTEAIDRVARHTDLPYRLIVIDDASTDPGIAAFLTARLATMPALLLTNSVNLGFVGSANRGIAAARAAGGPVVVLNSDALVPPGWLPRLLAPMLQQPDDIASVTPLSNAAEILSVPVVGPGQPLAPGQGDAQDRLAQALGALPQDIPTGIGFCMAMNDRFLARLGGFDPAFGRGYGEEVDWCQRARAIGGRHVVQPALFVEHRSGQSFAPAERRRATLAAAALLRRRYPRYEAEVQRFAATDPLLTERLALGVGLLDRGAPIDLHIAHSLGGGAEADLQRRLAGADAVVLRVGGLHRWRLELHGAAGVTTGDTDDFTLIRRLLQPLTQRRLIYNCAVGDPDAAALPDLLLSLLADSDPVEMRMHDYFPLSPLQTLLPSNGPYRGVPAADTTDPAHITCDADGRAVTLAQWRAAWARLIDRADVTCFSAASAALVAEVYPAARLTVHPHALPMVAPVAAPAGRSVIGVLGNIRLHKGAVEVCNLARLRPDLTIVIIGHLDPGLPVPATVQVHGRYRPDEVPALVARYGISGWLIPSIWPETFCFTVHEALATGLPVLGFDLGAQGDALRAAPNGRVVAICGGAPALAAALD